MTNLLCCAVVGMLNKTQCLPRSWGLLNDSKHIMKQIVWQFRRICHDYELLRCPDLAIFVLTDTTNYFTPHIRAHGNYNTMITNKNPGVHSIYLCEHQFMYWVVACRPVSCSRSPWATCSGLCANALCCKWMHNYYAMHAEYMLFRALVLITLVFESLHVHY